LDGDTARVSAKRNDGVVCPNDAALSFSLGGFVMALSKTGICDFGWKAKEFALKSADGKTYTLADVRGP